MSREMDDGKSVDQELAEAVLLNRVILSALDRMANRSCGWKAEDFQRFAKAIFKKEFNK